MSESEIALYRERFPHLQRIAERLGKFLNELLIEQAHIDRISTRAKDPERFEMKANAVNTAGEPKYSSPLSQIQDQIGARVIVFYKEDIRRIGETLERYFQHVERKDLVPDSEWEFGYFGRHWVFVLPQDVVPEDISTEDIPDFVELQVKTLFQHAWSEANHDLGYKAPGDLTTDQKRRFAYTSAQAWGADRVFDELRSELLGGEEAGGDDSGEDRGNDS